MIQCGRASGATSGVWIIPAVAKVLALERLVLGLAALTRSFTIRLCAPARLINLDPLTLSPDITVTVRARVAAIASKAFIAAWTRLAPCLQITVTEARTSRPGRALSTKAVNTWSRAGCRAERTASRSAAILALFRVFGADTRICLLLASSHAALIACGVGILWVTVTTRSRTRLLATAATLAHKCTLAVYAGVSSRALRGARASWRSWSRWRVRGSPVAVDFVANGIVDNARLQEVVGPAGGIPEIV